MREAVARRLESKELLRSPEEYKLWEDYCVARSKRMAARLPDLVEKLTIGGTRTVQNLDGNQLDWNWAEATTKLCIKLGARMRLLAKSRLEEMLDGMNYARDTGLRNLPGFVGARSLLLDTISLK
jgi:hypothetical protein